MKKKLKIAIIILLIILLIYILFWLFNNTSNKYIDKDLNVLFTVISNKEYDLRSDVDNNLQLQKENQLFLHRIKEDEFDLKIEDDSDLIALLNVSISYSKDKYDVNYKNNKINFLLPEDTKFIHIIYDPKKGTYEFAISKKDELYSSDKISEINGYVDLGEVSYYNNNNIHIKDFGILIEDGSFLSNDSIWYSNQDKVYDLKDKKDFDQFTKILNANDIELSENGFITIKKYKVTYSFDDYSVILWEKQINESESGDNDNNDGEDNDSSKEDVDSSEDDEAKVENPEDNDKSSLGDYIDKIISFVQGDNSDSSSKPSLKPGNTTGGANKPGESKPEETKPGESKPGETKPGETKPEETKPSDTEIITDTIELAFFENIKDFIYPGIDSNTDFTYVNKNSYNVKLNIESIEQNGKVLPIPFKYKLKVNGTYIVDQWSTLDQIKNTQITVNPKSKADFVLEWLWPYEGDNNNDTTIGTGLYFDKDVIMTVYLEQV